MFCIRLILPVLLLLVSQHALAEDAPCKTVDNKVTVANWTIDGAAPALQCAVTEDTVVVAYADNTIVSYDKAAKRKLSTWKTENSEKLTGFRLQNSRIYAITATYSLLPLVLESDGTIQVEDLEALSGVLPAGDKAETGEAGVTSRLDGKITETKRDIAILNIGSKQGVELGMKFAIHSQKPITKFNLLTNRDEIMPSDEVTGVLAVTQVTEEKCLLKLGLGDLADAGDVARSTKKKLSEQVMAPRYPRELHRVHGRIAPFVGISTLNIGTFADLSYDYTFAFPLRLSAGFSNSGILFGYSEHTRMIDDGQQTFERGPVRLPFAIDVIPSYDTDFFEVGIGAGYSYSAHDQKRGFTFLQKVRLGSLDGVNLTVTNSFIFQEKHDSWFSSFSIAAGADEKAGTTCTLDEWAEDFDTGYEFGFNSIDVDLRVPITSRVALETGYAFSQAGWVYGEIGIRTRVMGNGGDGSLFIPVSIGGGMIMDYHEERTNLECDAESQTLQQNVDYDSNQYGGPMISVGIDYRWK